MSILTDRHVHGFLHLLVQSGEVSKEVLPCFLHGSHM